MAARVSASDKFWKFAEEDTNFSVLFRLFRLTLIYIYKENNYLGLWNVKFRGKIECKFLLDYCPKF